MMSLIVCCQPKIRGKLKDILVLVFKHLNKTEEKEKEE